MLVLSRKVNQAVIVSETITIRVLRIMGGKVRLGIEAPRQVPVFREELIDASVSRAIDDPFLPSEPLKPSSHAP
jgi:carbon storage regulator